MATELKAMIEAITHLTTAVQTMQAQQLQQATFKDRPPGLGARRRLDLRYIKISEVSSMAGRRTGMRGPLPSREESELRTCRPASSYARRRT